MLVRTNNKEEAFRAAINTWLKDQVVYCNYCGKEYTGDPNCCENPQIGKNIDHCRGCIKQNELLRETRNNDFASNESKNIRWGLSLPPRLFLFLDRYKKSLEQPGLFKEQGEMQWFAKKFPMFAICKKI